MPLMKGKVVGIVFTGMHLCIMLEMRARLEAFRYLIKKVVFLFDYYYYYFVNWSIVK